METLEYKDPGVEASRRFSALRPRESRVFDIKKVLTEGIDMTIGCISFNLFDYQGHLKNKNKGFNVWPFYHHDPQLGCMKEYNAVSSKIFKAKDKRRKL